MTLRLRFSLIIGLIALLLIAKALWEATDASRNLLQVEGTLAIETFNSRAGQATAALRLEQGLGRILLTGKVEEKRSFMDQLADARQNAAAHSRELSSLLTAQSGLSDALRDRFNESTDQLSALRLQLQRALAGDGDAASGLTDAWQDALNVQQQTLTDIAMALENGASATPKVVALRQARALLESLSLFAGQERDLLAPYIASNVPMFPSELAPIRAASSQADVRLLDLTQMAERMPAEMQEEMRAATRVYTQQVQETREDALKAGQSGRDYDIGLGEWFSRSNSAINGFTVLSEQVSAEILEEIRLQEGQQIIALSTALAVVLVSLFATGFAYWTAQRYIQRPISSLIDVMSRIADGDLEVWVPEHKESAEIGAMARAIYRFKQEARENERYRGEQEEFKQQTVEEQRQVLQNVADAFEDAVGGIATTLSRETRNLVDSAKDLTSSANESSSQGTSVRNLTSSIETTLQEVTRSASELDRATREIAEKVELAARHTADTTDRATQTSDRVSKLNQTSAAIRDIVTLISDIAEQTNLLALNATIEAARAGTHGKGFAVVASEVKSLASQTQFATEEISRQIDEMLREIATTTEAVGLISRSVVTAREQVMGIANMAQAQSSSTNQIARAMAEASTQVRNTRSVSEGMANVASSTVSSANGVVGMAEIVANSTIALQKEADEYLRQVRFRNQDETSVELF